MMKRRQFISLLGGAAAAWPVAARGQEVGRTYRLAILIGIGPDMPQMLAFFDELRRFGFVEGQNLYVLPGSFDIRNEHFAERAAVMVKAAPDVIFTAGGGFSVRAAQEATRTIPIVGGAEDMVAEGLVASLARPGGNTTGLSLLSPELDGKRQDILTEAVPGVRRMAALVDPNATLPRHLQALEDAARARGVALSVIFAGKPEEIVPAINDAKASGAEALNVLATALFSDNRRIIFERVAAVRLPAIYQWPEMAEEGGLLAYGPRNIETFRQRARIVVKILRGANPADIPIEQPTRFEMVINLRTAKAIGHEVPAGLVLRADKVIE
jgi:putative ABC transport system substrate-binding protein